ncbi:Ribosomal biogenesis protein Gar2 [Venturia nashicola]|uniref:Ribosomal biogenesis protein Gar2 n=1 Tax=Venturia nashicola TaxID=86259 RepID=A0A4Z1NT62_9PEZI|nr:Ribosomal biogenesis protein Gar2 [Venturia nashicola]TLD19009.1 Ribosomal biogenesis protein Gar2 [Venturia nashicola]
MPPESTKTKTKRKSLDRKVKTSEDAPPAKKAKTTTTEPPSPKPEKVKAAAEAKKNRKRAADFIDTAEVEVEVEKAELAPKRSKKQRVVAPVEEPAEETVAAPKAKKTKVGKKVKKTEEVIDAPEPAEEKPAGEEDDIADQTAALLAGFDSTDESEAGDDEGIPLDMIPKVKLDNAAKKALAAAKKDADDVPGTIYVGRIPHGFYEHQMKAYFTQFGDVNHLRLARNKKTGASKHYAFVEFSSQEVAEIVAKTMNNYLMFGHIMKLRLMTPEQVHKDLWKGAGKRFKVIPRAKLAARDLAQPKGRDYWRKRVESEEKARAEKMEKLKELGYQFEMPAIRKVEDVAMKGTDEATAGEVQAVAGAEEVVVDAPVKAIEPSSAVVVDDVEKEVMSVIAKKKAKGKGSEIIGDAVRVTKKTKKAKKVKA